MSGGKAPIPTLFKLPGGRAIPMQRAIAQGFADAQGNALNPPVDSQAAAVLHKEARKQEWEAKQGIAKPRRRGEAKATGADEPETTADGKIKRKREPKPLVPANVDHSGQPITDEETLAEIAAKTAAIEAAKAEGFDPADADLGANASIARAEPES